MTERLDPPPRPDLRGRIGRLGGPLVFAGMLLLPPPSGMAPEAWLTAAVAVWMALWWVSEAVPIPATALLPLVLLPLLDIRPVSAAAAPYADPVIFLFLGGFLLAIAMQRWHLHRRIALAVIARVGTRPLPLIGGFMVASAFLSMWVSNTATAVMMLPMGLSVVELARRGEGPPDANFAVALMLGIAYASSIGGVATLIGSPPNALLVGYLASAHELEVGFAQWMLVGLPLTLVMLPLAWLLLTRVVYPVHMGEIPGGAAMVAEERRAMGPLGRAERTVALVFACTALAWIVRPLLSPILPALSDASIAIAAGVLLFALPSGKGGPVITWEDAKGLPWDVLVLFGGGLSLAAAIGGTGLADWIGAALSGLAGLPLLGIMLVVSLVIIFLTELTSNTASAATFLPVLGALALGIGADPLYLVVPAALAASCAFMLPVATPPNAIVYGSSFITVPQMVRAGLWLNLMFAVAIPLLAFLVVGPVFGR